MSRYGITLPAHVPVTEPELYALVPAPGKKSKKRKKAKQTSRKAQTVSPDSADTKQPKRKAIRKQIRGKDWYARNDNRQRGHTKHRQGALRRLGLAPEQLSSLPSITHLLAHADGGIPTVLAALRLCDDDDAQKFLDRYDAVSVSDREYLSLEEICVAAEVSPKRLLEMAVSALVEDNQSAGKIIAATYHPRVIRATAQAALYADGHQDRKLFLSGTQFVPQSGSRTGGVFSPVVNVNMQMAQTQTTAADPNALFNAAEEDLKVLHENIDGAKLLEAPKTIANANEIPIGHVYQDRDQEAECIPRSK